MEKSKSFLLSFLASFALSLLDHGHTQEGFISIDCGSDSNYMDSVTGINYISDSTFIDTGMVRPTNISSNLPRQLWTLRSFPQGRRNCYNVEVQLGTKYLIRASFIYANYDGQNNIPVFDLHFGANFWTSVTLQTEQYIKHEEIIHITTSDTVQVCLINTGKGGPFISALELRPVSKDLYVTVSGSLATFLRLDMGAENNSFIRYPDDIFDRAWSPPLPNPEWTRLSTSSSVYNEGNGYTSPSTVLSTASTVINASAPMKYSWNDQSGQFYVYLYFAELIELEANQSRSFDIYLNDQLYVDYDVSPGYLEEYVIYVLKPLNVSGKYDFNFIMTENSTLPPILNALEILKVMNFIQSTTEQVDADAIESIKKRYGVTKDWQGDPCAPEKFVWQGLNCSYDGSNPPRITVLNLSSSGLTGEITANISNLTMLEVLDLSNNSLSGLMPNFLTEMPLLRVLNLAGNNLSGQIPAALINKRNKGSLSLSLVGNPNLYVPAPRERKNNVVIPVLVAVGGFIIILIVMLASVYFSRRKRSPKDLVTLEPYSLAPLESLSRQYSYIDILRITNNFGRLLGEGGFGKVYYGQMGNTEVAVKMLSPKSTQGYREFKTEIDLILRLHHRNLTTLVGYCNEGERKMGLVYEYMCRGDLGSLLLGGKGEVLRWEDRLQIAIDSAQGIEYLHKGCRPPIIHRDIKPSNILLNEHLQAKLADFGLSRAFPTDGAASHVTTKIVGTLGYLDPEYYKTFRLTEKSDVYSFGIVLLELVTGMSVVSKSSERSHLLQWVKSNINEGDICSVIDSKINGGCNAECVWKAVNIAMSCTTHEVAQRPTMSEVVNELKECLKLELSQREGHQVESTTSISSTLFNSDIEFLVR